LRQAVRQGRARDDAELLPRARGSRRLAPRSAIGRALRPRAKRRSSAMSSGSGRPRPSTTLPASSPPTTEELQHAHVGFPGRGCGSLRRRARRTIRCRTILGPWIWRSGVLEHRSGLRCWLSRTASASSSGWPPSPPLTARRCSSTAGPGASRSLSSRSCSACSCGRCFAAAPAGAAWPVAPHGYLGRFTSSGACSRRSRSRPAPSLRR
jgi:hypothetical protein